MLRHVEANHVETAGHVCDICGSVAKTRHAFQMHKKRKHPELSGTQSKAPSVQIVQQQVVQAETPDIYEQKELTRTTTVDVTMESVGPGGQTQQVVTVVEEQDTETVIAVESLATGREKRKTAGNKMSHIIQQVHQQP